MKLIIRKEERYFETCIANENLPQVGEMLYLTVHDEKDNKSEISGRVLDVIRAIDLKIFKTEETGQLTSTKTEVTLILGN